MEEVVLLLLVLLVLLVLSRGENLGDERTEAAVDRGVDRGEGDVYFGGGVVV